MRPLATGRKVARANFVRFVEKCCSRQCALASGPALWGGNSSRSHERGNPLRRQCHFLCFAHIPTPIAWQICILAIALSFTLSRALAGHGGNAVIVGAGAVQPGHGRVAQVLKAEVRKAGGPGLYRRLPDLGEAVAEAVLVPGRQLRGSATIVAVTRPVTP